MSQISVAPPRRSMGLKLLLVCGLALLMAIPAFSVFLVILDRTNRAEHVVQEISDLVGGPQAFTGPILAVPYVIPPPAKPADGADARPITGTYVIFPKTGDGTAKIHADDKKSRGLFKATTWTADIALSAKFDLTDVGGQAPRGAQLDWSRAEILVGATDARGAQSDITLAVDGKTEQMGPGLNLSRSSLMDSSGVNYRSRLAAGGQTQVFFGAPAGDIAQPGKIFTAKASLKFAGAQRLALLAFAESTTFHAESNWTSPSYDGGFLPTHHSPDGDGPDAKASADGFNADWSVPYIARGVAGEGTEDILEQLGPTSLGVTFIEKANPYQAVSRSLKYAIMFIGLVFLAYFLFETVQKKRVHPAQYVLIGLAQVIFYLLLLSIAERIGFDLGFLIAATATVSLISAYAGWVFNSRKQGFVALGAFTGLYALIYVLMRLEDWALLVGAVTSFAAIAAVMYFTRNIDWYGAESAQVKEDG